MSPPRRTAGESAREADKAVFVMLAALIVLLLAATNFQLWRLQSGGEADGRTAATSGSALPPPLSGTSNALLSKQLRRLSVGLRTPFDELNTQMAGLRGLGGAQRDVARQIASIGGPIRQLGGVQRELSRTTSGLGKMVANTGEMSVGLAAMSRDTSATRESMNGLTKVMKRVEGGLAGTNAASREASAGTVAMRDAISAMASSIATTAEGSKETTAALAELNHEMGSLVELFCVAFNSSMPACATTEATGSPALEIRPEDLREAP